MKLAAVCRLKTGNFDGLLKAVSFYLPGKELAGRHGGFEVHLEWNKIKQEYRNYSVPRHVHNRWQRQQEHTTVTAVLGTVERTLQWAWKHTNLKIVDIQDLLNCEITYGRIKLLQSKGRTTKYLSNEVCSLRCQLTTTVCTSVIMLPNML